MSAPYLASAVRDYVTRLRVRGLLGSRPLRIDGFDGAELSDLAPVLSEVVSVGRVRRLGSLNSEMDGAINAERATRYRNEVDTGEAETVFILLVPQGQVVESSLDEPAFMVVPRSRIFHEELARLRVRLGVRPGEVEAIREAARYRQPESVFGFLYAWESGEGALPAEASAEFLGLLADSRLGGPITDVAARLRENARATDVLLRPGQSPGRIVDELTNEVGLQGDVYRGEILRLLDWLRSGRAGDTPRAFDFASWPRTPTDSPSIRFEQDLRNPPHRGWTDKDGAIEADGPKATLEWIPLHVPPGTFYELELVEETSQRVVKRIGKTVRSSRTINWGSLLKGDDLRTELRELNPAGDEEGYLFRIRLRVMRERQWMQDLQTLPFSVLIGPPPEDVAAPAGSLYHAVYRFHAEQKAVGPEPAEGEWTDLGSSVVRLVSAEGRGKEATLDTSPALLEIERTILSNPDLIGPMRWVSDEEGLAAGAPHLRQESPTTAADPEAGEYLAARRRFFELVRDRGSMERVDLRTPEVRGAALAYVESFRLLVENLQEHARAAGGVADADRLRCGRYLGIDSVVLHVLEPSAAGQYPVLMVSPTSPVVVAWLLDFQDMVYDWSRGRFDPALKPPYRGILDNLSSGPRSMVYATPGPSDNVSWWGFGGNIASLWQCYLPLGEHGSARSRDWENRVLSILGLPRRAIAGGRSDARRIGSRLKRYCVLHPNTNQLKLAVVVAGEGMEVLDALRVIDEKTGTPPGAQSVRDIRYELTLVGPQSTTLGRAIDDFTLNPGDAKWRRYAEAILDNPETVLSPSFAFAKRALPASLHAPAVFWSRLTEQLRAFEDGVNVTILGPMLSASVGVAPITEDDSDLRMRGLTTRPTTRLLPAAGNSQYEGNWVLTIAAPARPGNGVSASTAAALAAAVNLAHGVTDAGRQVGLQVALAGSMSEAIRVAHEVSDWVVISDPLFSIELVDRPASAEADALLLDYSPEFDPYPGGRVVVTTSSLREVEALSGAVGQAFSQGGPMTAILASISARLLLSLANPTQQVVHGLTGLALTRMFLAAKDPASLVVPIDGHEDMFVARRKGATGEMADLLVISLEDGLKFHVVESKWTGKANLQAQLDGARGQARATAEVIRSEYVTYDGVDRAMRAENFLDVALFHLDRSRRHGLPTGIDAAQLREAFNSELLRTASITASVVAWCPDVSAGSLQGDETDGVKSWVFGIDDISRCGSMMHSWPQVDGGDTAREATARGPGVDGAATLAALAQVEEETISADLGRHQQDESTRWVGAELVETRVPAALVETAGARNVTTSGAATSQTTGAESCIVLGHVVGTDRLARWCPPQLSNGHLILIGGSGAGKTTALRHITSQLREEGVPVLVLDFHGDIQPFGAPERLYAFDYEGNASFVNPFHLDPTLGVKLTPTRLKWEFIEAWRSQYPTMGIQQVNFLTELIESVFADAGITDDPATWSRTVTFGDVIEHFEAADAPETVKAKIRAYMKRFSEWKIFHGGEGIGVEMFLDQSVRLDLLQLDEMARNILADVVLRRLFLLVRALGPVDPAATGWKKFRVYVVIDEAQLLMGGTGDVKASLTKYAAEARKFGVGLILATQLRDNVPADIWGNIDTRLFMQALDPIERSRNARAANVAEDVLRSLSRGEAILISSSQPRQIPVTVKIEPAWL